MTDLTTTRRAVLAGSAALPALALPAGAETADPAVAVVRRWLASFVAWRNYRTPDGSDFDTDAGALAVEAETDARFAAIGQTPPTTAAGLALGLAAVLYDSGGTLTRSTFHDAATWFPADREPYPGEAVAVALFRSPAARDVFAQLGAVPAVSAAPMPVEADPMVAWLEEWKAARAEWLALAPVNEDWDTPRMLDLHMRERELADLIGRNVATSAAGIVALATLALDLHGHMRTEAAEDYAEHECSLEQQVLQNLLTSAERLSGTRLLA